MQLEEPGHFVQADMEQQAKAQQMALKVDRKRGPVRAHFAGADTEREALKVDRERGLVRVAGGRPCLQSLDG